jgi:hypothetical protein
MGLSLLPGIGEAGMVVHIEDTPDRVEREIGIASPTGLTLGLPLPLHGAFDQRFRVFAVPLDQNLDKRMAELGRESFEIHRFRLLSFAEHQDAPPRLNRSAAAREATKVRSHDAARNGIAP